MPRFFCPFRLILFLLLAASIAKRPVPRCRVIDKDVGDGSDKFPVLYNRAAAHALDDAAHLVSNRSSVTLMIIPLVASVLLLHDSQFQCRTFPLSGLRRQCKCVPAPL